MMEEGHLNKNFLVFLLLVGPFFLNDLANIFVSSWQWWLVIDYSFTKLLPGLVIYSLWQRKSLSLADIGLVAQPLPLFLTFFLVTGLVTVCIDQNAYTLLAKLPGFQPLGGIPVIDSSFWKWIDLTIGLLLVGMFEELIFRGYMLMVIRQYTKNPTVIVLVSALIFGLIHWSLGLHAVLITALIGAVFMLAYLWSRSLPAIMLAHFLVNFIDFAGVIPKSLFRVI